MTFGSKRLARADVQPGCALDRLRYATAVDISGITPGLTGQESQATSQDQ